MKNNETKIKVMALATVVTLSLGFYGCSGKAESPSTNLPADSAQTTAETTTGTETAAVELTLEQLKTFNGQDGQPAYVALDGVIYDVSQTRKWKDGKHEMGIVAGTDLTELISTSPHGKAILSEAKIVGKIVE